MPRLLAGAALACVLALGPATIARSSVAQPQADQALQLQLVRSINAYREAHGLRPLRVSLALATSAGAHGDDMAENGYFGHDSFDGTPFSQRILLQFASGHARISVGENLLWATGSPTADALLASWIASASHRENLLDARWRAVGVSAIDFSASPGVFAGWQGVIVTADFATAR